MQKTHYKKKNEPEQIQNMPHVHLCGLGYLVWSKLVGTKWNKIKHDWKRMEKKGM